MRAGWGDLGHQQAHPEQELHDEDVTLAFLMVPSTLLRCPDPLSKPPTVIVMTDLAGSWREGCLQRAGFGEKHLRRLTSCSGGRRGYER